MKKAYNYTGSDKIKAYREYAEDGLTYKEVKVSSCGNCGEDTNIILGHWSTGEKLPSGYTPAKDELVANEFMECKSCNEIQIS